MSGATNDSTSLQALLAGVKAGDERAAAVFVHRYEPLLRLVLRVRGKIRWAQSQLESQDLAQSVFVQVIEAIRGGVGFSDEAGLEGYLTSVGRNRLRDYIRRLKAAKRDRRRTITGGPAALAELPEAAPSPSEIVVLREQVARVEGCTAPAELEVLRAHADGAAWHDLAAAHNTSPEALRKRIDRVRARLRKTLGE
jgi:RNA polymerase sigma factor (sigma-70 family)